MDAAKFINILKRVCKMKGLDYYRIYTDADTELLIKGAEEWAAEHTQTRQSKFLKMFPEAQVDEGDCLIICPYNVSDSYRKGQERCTSDLSCKECRREFWLQEVE